MSSSEIAPGAENSQLGQSSVFGKNEGNPTAFLLSHEVAQLSEKDSSTMNLPVKSPWAKMESHTLRGIAIDFRFFSFEYLKVFIYLKYVRCLTQKHSLCQVSISS